MEILQKFYISSQKTEVESIPVFLPLTKEESSSSPNPREIAEILFITTETSTNKISLPFGIIIRRYRLRPVYQRVLLPNSKEPVKVLVGYRYEFKAEHYIPPVVSAEVIDLPKYILEYIEGLEHFLLPPHS